LGRGVSPNHDLSESVAVNDRAKTQSPHDIPELLEEVLTFTRQMGDMLVQLADDLERLADYPPELRRGADGFAARADVIEHLLKETSRRR
jgi:hypothetical protein